MTNAEYNRLDQDRPTRTARNRLKLLLKIAEKKRAAHKILRTGQQVSTHRSRKSLGEEVLAAAGEAGQSLAQCLNAGSCPSRCKAWLQRCLEDLEALWHPVNALPGLGKLFAHGDSKEAPAARPQGVDSDETLEERQLLSER
jgi:hypothetical protein